MGGGKAIKPLITEYVDFTVNTFRNWEPVECSTERSCVISFIVTENETGNDCFENTAEYIW